MRRWVARGCRCWFRHLAWVGKYYKVERNEESATILCFAADVSWFFCIFTTHVPPTQSKEAVRQSDIPTGPSMMEQPETYRKPPAAGFRQIDHEMNWNILPKTHRNFAGRKPRWVSGRSLVGLRLYIIDGPHGVSTSTYMYAGQVRRIVACYCYNKGEPACSNVFRFICGIILKKLKDRWALLLNYSLLNYEVSKLCTTYTHVLFLAFIHNR